MNADRTTLGLLAVLVAGLLAAAVSALTRGKRSRAMGALGAAAGAVVALLVVRTDQTYYNRIIAGKVESAGAMVVMVWGHPVYGMERLRGDGMSVPSHLAYLVEWGSMAFGALALGAISWKVVDLDGKARLIRGTFGPVSAGPTEGCPAPGEPVQASSRVGLPPPPEGNP